MDVFFYGLFMDLNILREKGIEPANPRMGFLKDFALQIGKRASLISSTGDRSFGVVMDVNETKLNSLYSDPSVADYLPEKVMVELISGGTVQAICYNLPAHLITGANEYYANSLYALCKRLNFPDEYLLRIKSFTSYNQ